MRRAAARQAYPLGAYAINWFAAIAIFAAGFVWGRLHGRRRTRADLERLTDLIVGGMSPAEERALHLEQEKQA